LAGEHPQTKALVLAQLGAKQASALLKSFEPEDRVECIRRMAKMGQFSAERRQRLQKSSIAISSRRAANRNAKIPGSRIWPN